MKKIFLLLLVLAMSCFTAMAQTAKIKRFSMTPDFATNTITIKLTFDINGCQGQKGFATAYFYDNNGNALRGNNGYATSNGNAAVWDTFTSPYQAATYTDFTLQIPAKALGLYDGYHYLRFTLAISSAGKNLVVKSNNRFDLQLFGGSMRSLVPTNADGSKNSYSYAPCAMCANRSPGKCTGCYGSGRMVNIYGARTCPLCLGTGQCNTCKGKGGSYSSTVIPAPSRQGRTNGHSGGYSGGHTGGYTGGGSSSGGGRVSGGTRTCPGCNGSGKGADEITWAPNYTGSSSEQYCSQCGRTTAPHSHRRPMCRVCYGKGYISN